MTRPARLRRAVLRGIGSGLLFAAGATLGGAKRGSDRGPDGPSPVDLGTLPEASDRGDSYATGVNARGTVVGWSARDPGYGHAVRWPDPDTVEDLGTLDEDGVGSSDARDINDSGAVVGAAWRGNPPPRAYRWTERDGTDDLGTLSEHPRSGSIVEAINDSGTVVGWSEGSPAAFRWTERDGMTAIDSFWDEPFDSTANAVANDGTVAGRTQNREGTVRTFRWTADDGTTELAPLSGDDVSVALGTNGSVVVGFSTVWSDWTDSRRAVHWNDGVASLATLDGAPSNRGTAQGCNERGDIVGTAAADLDHGDTRAVRWSKGDVEDLGSLADEGWSAAAATNSRGDVVGQSRTNENGSAHATLWEA